MVNKNELRAELARRGMNIADLAKLINVSTATVYRWLNDEEGFPLEAAQTAGKALGFDADTMMRIFFSDFVA